MRETAIWVLWAKAWAFFQRFEPRWLRWKRERKYVRQAKRVAAWLEAVGITEAKGKAGQVWSPYGIAALVIQGLRPLNKAAKVHTPSRADWSRDVSEEAS